MNVQRKEKGFTIIEVVLVLAIAGLIFLMVFIALPALQRSQRDTQRKNDVSRLVTAVTNYSSNNRGNLPTTQALWNGLITGYLTTGGSTFTDPSGTAYTLSKNTTNSIPTSYTSASSGTIYYSPGYTCDSTASANVVASSARQVAFRLVLEGGGVDCTNN